MFMICSSLQPGHKTMTDDERKLVAARIDRGFPHQVSLPLELDQDTEEDLIWWLDRRIGRWDMYVDPGRRHVRYCFFDQRDAAAFRLRFVAGTNRAAG
jgi:hypothetical protein